MQYVLLCFIPEHNEMINTEDDENLNYIKHHEMIILSLLWVLD